MNNGRGVGGGNTVKGRESESRKARQLSGSNPDRAHLACYVKDGLDVTVTAKPLTQHPRQWTRFQQRKYWIRLILRRSQWGANWRHK